MNNVDRCTKKASSRMDKKRREISRLPLFEKTVDGKKEQRSILMSRWPRKKETERKE